MSAQEIDFTKCDRCPKIADYQVVEEGVFTNRTFLPYRLVPKEDDDVLEMLFVTGILLWNTFSLSGNVAEAKYFLFIITHENAGLFAMRLNHEVTIFQIS